MIMRFSKHKFLLAAIFLVLLSVVFSIYYATASNTSTSHTAEDSDFAHKIQQHVIDTIGQPIEGFNAGLYMRAFPGLEESDFDGVETLEGNYVYKDGGLIFTRSPTGRISSAEEAITEQGHAMLFAALQKRLGDTLSVDEIISRTQNDASPPFVISVGDILGTMTVVSAAPFNTGQYSTDPKMMQIGPQNARIILRGPIEVTGAYSAVHSGIGFDGYCMLVSDTASLARLPILPVHGVRPDISSYSFCFRNAETVQQTLGEESRTITMAIDNFELNSYPAEVMSWADFVGVIDATP